MQETEDKSVRFMVRTAGLKVNCIISKFEFKKLLEWSSKAGLGLK
jgi:hypothetical protein